MNQAEKKAAIAVVETIRACLKMDDAKKPKKRASRTYYMHETEKGIVLKKSGGTGTIGKVRAGSLTEAYKIMRGEK